MKILDWIINKRPGKVSELDDRYEIEHESGEHSTLFKSNSKNSNETLTRLGDIYTDFDGMDLFSSTFKISSLSLTKAVKGVELIEPLRDIRIYVNSLEPKFPEEVIPFMYQSGIGIYAVGIESGYIFEWDTEESTLTEEYDDLQQIFDEWLEAIS